MSSPAQNLDHLKIPLEDILKATNHFSDENFIRQGGFGKIYKGTLFKSGAMIDIVARRLDRTYGQGTKEFLTEVSMLASLKHENLVSIVGFCDEKNEQIVVNEYEAKGSLDNYLDDPSLTWLMRLQICHRVALALRYIHYDEKRDFSVIHRNIKSSKILLDDNFEPKLAGFELSMTNTSSQRHRLCVTDACGTIGYVDPLCVMTNSVTHKSDMYSFGVVLFEVLFGRKAIIDKRDTKLAQVAKSHYEKRQLDDLIDSDLRKQMNQESFDIFSEAAYNCLKEQRSERPSIDQIVTTLEKALNLQREQEKPKQLIVAAALESTSNSSFRWKGLEHLKISFSDVKSAIANCQSRSVRQYGKVAFLVYKAQLKIFDSRNYLEIEGKGKSELPKKMSTVTIKRYIDHSFFYAEMLALSTYKHPNIVSTAHGICDEPTEKCILYDDDVTNGCLADYLGSDRSIDNFTWVRRIRLCIDVAHGLDYIHGRRKNNETKSQHIISSSNILLKENWEPMIGGFSEKKRSGSSTSLFMDIEYNIHMESLYGDRKEKDIYCFGILLFEILCWRFAHDPIYRRKNDKGLASFVRRCFKNGTQNEILHLVKLREEAEETIFSKGIDKKSFDTFSNIAYQCLGDSHFQCPTLNQVIEELEKALYFQENRSKNLKISLEKIMSATQNFNPNKRIGKGGFGQVYKGEFTGAHGCEHIAAKRLDKKSDQGITELMTEFEILSDYKHENIVGLVGYCDEQEEKIIVYEYACQGSLDRWLKYDALTWRKRLEICIDIANGLAFLHGTSETKQEIVIHRDIKSANVLLHGDWRAKIADFGLSLISPINQKRNYVIDNAKGTPGYCDPLYISTQFFTKESDIYSFGVLLFEMLCGRFVMEDKNSKDQNLVQLVKHHYKEGSLYEMVFEATKKQMAPRSLTTFANIAYQCIHEERGKRPTANEVLIQLKKALELQDNVDALIECVMRDTGFSRGKLVAAFTIYKCLVHWKSFESERTSVFDRLIQMIGSAIENQDNNEYMAYWLSNTSALVFLIQKSFKPEGSSSARKRLPPASLFGRMTMGFRSSSVSLAAPAAALEVVRQVEAKYPALLFKQQLTAYVEKIYGIVRDNLKKELGSLLALCIQAPRASKGVLRSDVSFGKDSKSSHWQRIVDCLNTLLKTLKDNFVPPIIVQKIFCQVFSYINLRLFNSVLLRRECCTFSNGEYVKAGLAELELRCCQANEEYVGSAWDELKHVRQAIGFLVIHEKCGISYDELTNDLCPVLSVRQLYRICTLYWDDKYNTKSVSLEVISSMRLLVEEDANTADSSSFLLDDDSSIPFSDDDLSTSLQVKDFADVKPAVELAENPTFPFLL